MAPPRIRHLQQPDGSHTCGQHCVAMAAGVEVSDVIAAIRKTGGTNTADMVRGFAVFGILTKSAKLIRFDGRVAPPEHSLLKVRHDAAGEGHRGHWVLNWAGIIHDPLMSQPGMYSWSRSTRFTGRLELVPFCEPTQVTLCHLTSALLTRGCRA